MGWLGGAGGGEDAASEAGGYGSCGVCALVGRNLFFFFITLKLSDTKVCEPQIRALLGTAGCARSGGTPR